MNDFGPCDRELIESYQKSGSPDDLQTLIARHLPRVRSIVYGMLGNDLETDDLTQEIFLKALRGLPNFQGQSEFRTWLYRIAMNAVYSHLRRRTLSPVSLPHSAEHVTDSAIGATATLLGQEVNAEIEAALAALSPALRAAIVLVCIEGREPTEVAQIENCTVSTIYWRIHEARRQLARRLEEYLK